MEPVVFTLQEVAELLKLSNRSVRRYVQRGDIPAVKVGQEWRISRADLENYFRDNGGMSLFGDALPDTVEGPPPTFEEEGEDSD